MLRVVSLRFFLLVLILHQFLYQHFQHQQNVFIIYSFLINYPKMIHYQMIMNLFKRDLNILTVIYVVYNYQTYQNSLLIFCYHFYLLLIIQNLENAESQSLMVLNLQFIFKVSSILQVLFNFFLEIWLIHPLLKSSDHEYLISGTLIYFIYIYNS